MSRTLTESVRRNEQPTYVMAWLANRKRTLDAVGDLAELLKPKARHLLPGHFPNATAIYRYAVQLHATREMLDAIPLLYLEYREAHRQMRFGDGPVISDPAKLETSEATD